jgi:arylsulfatase A-like enzyme
MMVLLAWAGSAAAAERVNLLLVLIDNWAYPHASIYGDGSARTPHFDRVARQGMLFEQAYCVVPSCSPARSVLLTGRPIHQLEAAANLWAYLPRKFTTYTELLEQSGYAVGYQEKGWSPGDEAAEGRPRNPAGVKFARFEDFLRGVKPDQPFCYWAGPVETALHQWQVGGGVKAGIDPSKVRVPGYLPDSPEVRSCIADYYQAVERADANLGRVLEALERSGRAERTLVVVAGDNGWQMPHGLANVYDAGVRVPMAVRWPRRVAAGGRHEGFVDFLDFAPTFLSAAGIAPPPEMSGRNLLPLLEGGGMADRGHVFLERERHANVRAGDRSYPCRAVRTRDHLYIRNFAPSLWPAGDPEAWMAVGPYGDVDNTPAKAFILAHRDAPALRRFYDINFGKRAAEELYDLRQDPDQTVNLAGRPEVAEAQARLAWMVEQWMRRTGDPRAADPDDDRWDRYPYYGGSVNPNRARTPMPGGKAAAPKAKKAAR